MSGFFTKFRFTLLIPCVNGCRLAVGTVVPANGVVPTVEPAPPPVVVPTVVPPVVLPVVVEVLPVTV
ncbi:MAG: hypothetical protein A2Z93_05985 [Curvibacter sp. GWA2_64_110]|nr:MAG: hypothetical protein A2Z93_05985 [Curvibacter sp. GWA2_64_110]HCY15651.1 hypothetical protein [Curvibacter sp.]